MDSKITLSYGSKSASTIVSNNFIDKYMTDARGSDVKVYIYLLRCVQNPSFPVSIESIAEALGETEKEIRIALKYWDEQHVLSVSTTRNGKIKDITLHDLDEDDDNEVDFGSNVTILSDARRNRKSIPEPAPAMLDGRPYGRRATDIAIPTPAPENEPEQDNATPIVKPNYSSQMIQSFKTEYPEFDELIDYIENLLGTTLSQRSLQTPAFIFEELGFPAELIKFLYDYCVGKGKRPEDEPGLHREHQHRERPEDEPGLHRHPEEHRHRNRRNRHDHLHEEPLTQRLPGHRSWEET